MRFSDARPDENEESEGKTRIFCRDALLKVFPTLYRTEHRFDALCNHFDVVKTKTKMYRCLKTECGQGTNGRARASWNVGFATLWHFCWFECVNKIYTHIYIFFLDSAYSRLLWSFSIRVCYFSNTSYVHFVDFFFSVGVRFVIPTFNDRFIRFRLNIIIPVKSLVSMKYQLFQKRIFDDSSQPKIDECWCTKPML